MSFTDVTDAEKRKAVSFTDVTADAEKRKVHQHASDPRETAKQLKSYDAFSLSTNHKLSAEQKIEGHSRTADNLRGMNFDPHG